MSQRYNALFAAINQEYDLRSGAGLNALGDLIAEETAHGERRSPWEHRNQSGQWVRMAGLRTAADKAVVRLASVTGASLPWNLNKGYKGWTDYSTPEAADKAVEDWKRWIGWLLAIDEHPESFPLLVALIKATQSDRGLGSPRTTCELRQLAEKFHFSPGRLERMLRATEWQANRFLNGFGIQFSRKRDWELMATVLAPRTEWSEGRQVIVGRSTYDPARAGKRLAACVINARLKRVGGVELGGKATEVLVKARGLSWVQPLRRRGKKDAIEWVHPHPREVVAWAVTQVNAGEFASLREALTVSDRLVRDTTDEVECLVDKHAAEEIHGVRVTPGYKLVTDHRSCTRVQPMWLVTRGARTFHAKKHEWVTTREAIRLATKAWRAQDQAATMARRDFPHLLRDNVTILVTREDSYRAGNCQPGTESWIDSTGIGRNHWCVPAKALLGHSSDVRVARVLAVANEAAAKWLARRHAA